MSIMHVQRYGSINHENEGEDKGTALYRPSETEREARASPPFANATSARAVDISWISWSSSSSTSEEVIREARHRSYSPVGRPPRHPDRKISKTFDGWHPPTPGFVRDLDYFRNEKYPADILDRFERENGNLSYQRKAVAGEDVPSLLVSSEELDNGTVLSESETHDEKEYSPCIFQFWNIWGQGNCGQQLACWS